jgi:nuclear GTP-binding protein
MGKCIKKKPGAISASHSSSNPDRALKHAKVVGGHARTKSTMKLLKLRDRGGNPVRNASGRIVQAAEFQSTKTSGTRARVQPDRRWFGNTRVIGQAQLQKFQEEGKKAINDPYKMILRQSKLPISLINDKVDKARPHLVENHSKVFGSKSTRKRVNLRVGGLMELVGKADNDADKYTPGQDHNLLRAETGSLKFTNESGVNNVYNNGQPVQMRAGQSKRIWGELYKVIDSSDVILNILDARDPEGTRCRHIENYLKREKPHKHLVFILNKADLVPPWITQKWVAILSKERPTLAFHAGRFEKPFGKGALISLLRQFGKLHSDKKNISVGLCGYPNVGKSSVINSLRNKKVCNVAPIPGETKVWQYVTLMKNIYLVDCPGVVYNHSTDSEIDTVLKGVIRTQYLESPEDYIPQVLERVKTDHIKRHYQIAVWTSALDFLEKVAKRTGKLLKGGDPDTVAVGKMVLNDWQRGKLPYFEHPPQDGDQAIVAAGEDEDASALFDKVVKPGRLHDTNTIDDVKKRALVEKRLAQEATLKIEDQDLTALAKIDFDMDEGDYEVNQDGFLEEEEPDSEDSEAEDEIEEIDEMETTEIDANAEFDQEAELKKLDKQLAGLRRRDKALDMSRMEVVKTVKRRAPYDAMQDEGYNAKKGVRDNDKGRNVDIAEEERLANEMKKRMAKRQKQDENKAKSLAKKF